MPGARCSSLQTEHCLPYGIQSEPDRRAEDALIKVDSVGICGSDMHAYLGHDERRVAPLILGHEAAGQVVEGPMKGQRVVVNPLVTCGECGSCLSGRSLACASPLPIDPTSGWILVAI